MCKENYVIVVDHYLEGTMNRMKKIVGSLALAALFVTSLGISSFAQDWRRDRWDDRWERQDDRWDRRNDRWDQRDDRWDRRNDRWDRRNDRRDDRWDDRNGNNSYVRKQMEKGYRDGLDRGRKDAQTNRRRDPNNSSHYREGNRYYRAGFERGFFEAYNRYSDYGRDRGRRGW
jgi:hypothetical protein